VKTIDERCRRLVSRFQWQTLAANDINAQILKALIPMKYYDGNIIPSGQIFIGLATHQSTGIGMHIFSHLIPTIERENLDLQDPYISIWNEELLASIGKIVRFIYDQAIIEGVNNSSQQSGQSLNTILAPYAFQPSVPNKEIGSFIVYVCNFQTDELYVGSSMHRSNTTRWFLCIRSGYSRSSQTVTIRRSLVTDSFDRSLFEHFETHSIISSCATCTVRY
jgi:hypothetical protein